MRFERKFYISCPDCRQRMRRVCMEGDDIYSLKIGYACPCGLHWTYFANQNSLEHGLPVEEDNKAAKPKVPLTFKRALDDAVKQLSHESTVNS